MDTTWSWWNNKDGRGKNRENSKHAIRKCRSISSDLLRSNTII
jgi:hypothetical protein